MYVCMDGWMDGCTFVYVCRYVCFCAYMYMYRNTPVHMYIYTARLGMWHHAVEIRKLEHDRPPSH